MVDQGSDLRAPTYAQDREAHHQGAPARSPSQARQDRGRRNLKQWWFYIGIELIIAPLFRKGTHLEPMQRHGERHRTQDLDGISEQQKLKSGLKLNDEVCSSRTGTLHHNDKRKASTRRGSQLRKTPTL